MKSMGQALKEFNLEDIKRRAMEAAQNRTLAEIHTLQTKTTPKCPKCRDEYFHLYKDENGIEYAKECECKEQRKVERLFNSSKITLEFQKKNFDTFNLEDLHGEVRMAYKIALAYFSNFDRIRNERQNSMCLLGNPGCGKTHLLMAVSNALMHKGVQVLYFPWVEGFNEIKDDLSLTEERVNRMQKADVLFIDDMWKGRKEPTPFQIEQAFAIINYRYMEKLPVLISSERNIDQMCDFDEAIGSRIAEMCKSFRVELFGGRELNYRLREDAV